MVQSIIGSSSTIKQQVKHRPGILETAKAPVLLLEKRLGAIDGALLAGGLSGIRQHAAIFTA